MPALDTLPVLTHVLPGVLLFRDPLDTWFDGERNVPKRLHVSTDPAALPAPTLYPLSNGEALLIGDWTDSNSPAYRVPAHLYAAVSAALNLKEVTA